MREKILAENQSMIVYSLHIIQVNKTKKRKKGNVMKINHNSKYIKQAKIMDFQLEKIRIMIKKFQIMK